MLTNPAITARSAAPARPKPAVALLTFVVAACAAQTPTATSSLTDPFLCQAIDNAVSSPSSLPQLSPEQISEATDAVERVYTATEASALDACRVGETEQAVAIMVDARSAAINRRQLAGELPGQVLPSLERALTYSSVHTVLSKAPGQCREDAPHFAALAFRYYQSAAEETRNLWQKSLIYNELGRLAFALELPQRSAELLQMRGHHCGELAQATNTPRR